MNPLFPLPKATWLLPLSHQFVKDWPSTTLRNITMFLKTKEHVKRWWYFNNLKQNNGLPWWLSSGVSAYQSRRNGSDPWPRKIPHATEQLSPSLESRNHSCWAHVLQPVKPECPRARVPRQEKPLQWEALVPQLENIFCSLQLEKSPHGDKGPAQSKVNKITS